MGDKSDKMLRQAGKAYTVVVDFFFVWLFDKWSKTVVVPIGIDTPELVQCWDVKLVRIAFALNGINVIVSAPDNKIDFPVRFIPPIK